jgi:hypothetical protein
MNRRAIQAMAMDPLSIICKPKMLVLKVMLLTTHRRVKRPMIPVRVRMVASDVRVAAIAGPPLLTATSPMVPQAHQTMVTVVTVVTVVAMTARP